MRTRTTFPRVVAVDARVDPFSPNGLVSVGMFMAERCRRGMSRADFSAHHHPRQSSSVRTLRADGPLWIAGSNRILKMWAQQDLNLRPKDYESSALTN